MGVDLALVNGLIEDIQGRLAGGGGGEGQPPVPTDVCEAVATLSEMLNELALTNGPDAIGAKAALRLAFFKPTKLHCHVTTDDIGSDNGNLFIELAAPVGVELVSAISMINGLLPGLLTTMLGVDFAVPNTPLTIEYKLNNGQSIGINRLPLPFVGHVGVRILEEDDWNSDDTLRADVEATSKRDSVILEGSTGKYEIFYELTPLLGDEGLLGDVLGCEPGGVGKATSKLSAHKIAWSRVGHPAHARRIAAAPDGPIYALNDNESLWINEKDGIDSAWVNIGSLPEKTSSISASSTRLYYLDGDRILWALDRTNPTAAPVKIGNPYAAKDVVVMAMADKAVLWALNDDRSLWRNDNGGDDGSWKKVGVPFAANRIAASGRFLYALNDDKTLWRSETGADNGWAQIDHPHSAGQIAAATRGQADVLFALNNDFSLWKAGA